MNYEALGVDALRGRRSYPAERTEAFLRRHNVSFEFFGGVPGSILYDNTKLAVERILGDGTRQRTRIFVNCSPLSVRRSLRVAGQGQ